MKTATAVTIPPKYAPEKDKNGFMNPVMLEYFRQKLIAWRTELLKESEHTIQETLPGTDVSTRALFR